MKIKPIEEIRATVEKTAAELGIEIVDVEFKMSKNPSLTVYAETEDGIDLNSLEKLHLALDEPLDALDPTFGSPYTLNVSSPGLDRPLKTARDFERRIGLDVEIKLFAPLRGKKYFEGVLVSYDGNAVTVDIDGSEEKFELTKISKINEAVKFN